MKIVLLASLLMVTGCGNDIRRAIGADYNNRIQRDDTRIKVLERRVMETEASIEENIFEMQYFSELLGQMSDAELAQNQEMRDEQILAQAQIDHLVEQLAVLQGYDSIIATVDPCGDGHGYDEVLMRTVSGKWIAYFESGSNRFLSVIPEGNYRTTDQQSCNFSIDSQGNLHD